MVSVDDPEAAVEGTHESAQPRPGGRDVSGDAAAGPAVLPMIAADVLWSAAEDLEIPISFHIGTNRVSYFPGGNASSVSMSAVVNVDYWVRTAMADIILSGVFERHPKLKIVTVEYELGWIPFFLNRLDYAYTQRPSRNWPTFRSDASTERFLAIELHGEFPRGTPALAMSQWKKVGLDTFAFGSDYPYIESTFRVAG